MKKVNLIFPVVFAFLSCQKKEQADYILKDAVIYTMNEKNEIAECVAVKNGKILATGTNKEVLGKYESDSVVSLKNQFVYPAFHDAHAHFFGLANYLGECNLFGAKSVQEILQRLKSFQKNNPHKQWITGRGWDQNLFEDKNFPTKKALDSVFPKIPVCLTRVDGHAVWINSKAIEICGLNKHTIVEGGELIKDNKGELTGILIDNATALAEKNIPPLSRKELIELLVKADSICRANHIQYIHEAGLELWQIKLLDSLIDKGIIHTKFYVMAALTNESLNYFLKNGTVDKDKIKVKAFKIYADGALGSRGALLKKKYADKNSFGLLLISKDSLFNVLQMLYEKGFQACTHAIGDSANKIVLQSYAQILKGRNNRRWRIEHAQIVDSSDLRYFKEYNIIPSVQPTHAISDKYWAVQRLGKERIQFAYAYQSLWQQNNLIALGTDFPVEDVSPFKTFFASVFRSDYDLKNKEEFQPNEGLNRLQTLKGMTSDAAYAAFSEKETGSIESGKNADFTILNIDLMHISKEQLSEYILKGK